MNDDVLEAGRLLAAALRRENQLLARMELQEASLLVAEKQAATARFEAACRAAGRLRWSPQAEDLAASLRVLASENTSLLEHAMAAQERVLGIIRQAALKCFAGRRYGAGGAPAAEAPRPMALSSRA